MKLASDVTNLLLQIENTDRDVCSHELEYALLDAERMADQFENIKPTPYIVPIERAVGAYHLNQTENNA